MDINKFLNDSAALNKNIFTEDQLNIIIDMFYLYHKYKNDNIPDVERKYTQAEIQILYDHYKLLEKIGFIDFIDWLSQRSQSNIDKILGEN